MKIFNFIKNYLASYIRVSFLSLSNNIKCERRVKVYKNATLKTDKSGEIVINNNVTFKENAEIYACGGKIELKGSNFINRNTMIVSAESVVIGKGTTIGPNTVIYDHDHDIKQGKGFVSGPVIIGENVWIGAGVTILKGAVIGDGSVIAAGSIVRGEVPSNVIAYNRKELEFKPIIRQ